VRGERYVVSAHDGLFRRAALRQHLAEFIDRYPALRRRIEYRGFAIPLRNKAGVFERGPVVLLGDAAGRAGDTGYRECVRKTVLAAPWWLTQSARSSIIVIA